MDDPIATAPGSDTNAGLLVSVNAKPVARYNQRALEQIVGRERNQRAWYRQLVRDVVVARRVNSTGRERRERVSQLDSSGDA